MRSVYYPRVHATVSAFLDGRGRADADVVVDVLPVAASWRYNGYHEADTWTLDFDARQFPFDPELIRSAAVEIYAFAADSMGDRRDWKVAKYRRMVGIADDAMMESTGQGRIVRLSGRDYTGLLLDADWDPRLRIPSGKSLSDTVQVIVSDTVRDASGGTPMVVKFLSDRRNPVVGMGERGVKRKKGKAPGSGQNVWDVIYEMCIRHGFIVFVEGADVIIADPRHLAERLTDEAPAVAYGRNLAELVVKRSLIKERVPQVIVEAFNPRTKKRVVAKYPKNPAALPPTGIGTERDQRLRIVPPDGVYDLETLTGYAKSRYEMMARSESEYTFSTRHLEDLADKSMFDLRAGKPVMISFDAVTKDDLRQLTPAQRFARMVTLGYSIKVARAVAASADALTVTTQPYYVQEAGFNWDLNGKSLEIDCMAQNYAFATREESTAV